MVNIEHQRPQSPRSRSAPATAASRRCKSRRAASSRSGRRRYWPILEACAANGFPVSLHLGGTGGHPSTGGGHPSFYHEEHPSYVQTMQTLVTSLVCEGVFEHIPNLKVVLVEGGFAWLPALCWRLDKHWKRLQAEVPFLRQKPSEYVRQNIWVTTQPIEEPERPRDMLSTLEWIGVDRVMFSTDYPHWDQDDPRYAFKVPLPEEWRRKIYRDNARGSLRPRLTMSRHVVATVDEIAPGTCKIVTVKGREIGVFHVERRVLRADQPLPASGRAAVPRCDRQPAGVAGARRIPADAAGRDAALPVALLGVRYPHRAVVVRSRQRARPHLCRRGGTGRDAGQGAVRGGDGAGDGGTGLCRDHRLAGRNARGVVSAERTEARVGARRRPRRSGGAPVRLEDVARQAGVSTASVSRALNTPNLVSPELRDRIARAAQALNWVPNGVAKALASLRTRTIGVMIPTLSHQNFAILIEALQHDLGAARYTLILCCIDVSEGLRLQQARKLIEQGIECLVLVGEAQPDGLFELLRSQNVPVCHHLHERPRQNAHLHRVRQLCCRGQAGRAPA